MRIAEDEAVEEPGDAEALALGDVDFGAGVSVGQLGAFSLVQGAGYLGELFRKLLGDLGSGALGFEELGILEGGKENAPVLRAVNVVVDELVNFLDRAVEVGLDDVAVEVADDQQGWI